MSIKKLIRKKVVLISSVIVLIIALLLLGVFIGKLFVGHSNYYAVYLSTGDLYFGKLSKFPFLELKDVWYIQSNQENGGVSLNEFSKVFWGPGDEMKLNRDNIMWIVKIRDDSQILPILRGEQVYAPNPNAQNINPTSPNKTETETGGDSNGAERSN